jgi:hypothetical protein
VIPGHDRGDGEPGVPNDERGPKLDEGAFMSIGVDPSIATENERQQRIGELTAEYGPTWDEAYRPGSLGCHELLDRTCVLADQLESTVLSHPACVRNSEWYALASRAVELLRELYQRVGSEHC